ncbi:MAG: hypothetical protein QN198_08360 [Armatimonadota bacterium]|nr:hypothetical protein [Armatimonadota bacterium]MDR5703602.1 hypothetical protein [Armatimonadota bacterium]MDR7435378.1 hypothetical protein [Armatimonadota bacterium]
MQMLLETHRIFWLVGVAIAINFICSVWAYAAHRRGRNTLGPVFWALLAVAQAAMVLQIVTGGILWVNGLRPKTSLHYLYGFLVLLTVVSQYGLKPGGRLRAWVSRQGGGFREPLVMALLCLFLAGLIARAYTTGLWGR